MGSVLKHPLARGALNCSWPTVTRASGTARGTHPPSSGPVTIYVHCACRVEIRRDRQNNIDLSDALSPQGWNHPSSPQEASLEILSVLRRRNARPVDLYFVLAFRISTAGALNVDCCHRARGGGMGPARSS